MSALAAASRARPAGPFRLRGRLYKAALTAHILASVGWFGTAVLVATLGLAAGSADRTFAAASYRVMEQLPVATIPMGLAAIATGATLSLGTTWGLFRHWWVVAKIGISCAVVVTDALVVAEAAHRALASGHADGRLYGSTIAHVVVLLVATVLSVFKPRARTPWKRF